MSPDHWPGIAHLQDEAQHARDVTFVKLCIFIATRLDRKTPT